MHFHDISPFLWRISDTSGIQWNGLSYMLSLIVSFVFMSWMSYRQRSELGQKRVWDFVLVCAIGALLGGRLGYCFFYAPELFLRFRAEFPFWGVLAVDEGGMSSFGAILGLAISSTLFAVRTGVSRLYLYDLIAVTAPIGIFFGRIANFLTGEFIGKPASSELPFSVKFPTEIYYWPRSEPGKLAELSQAAEKIGADPEQWKVWASSYQAQADSQSQVHQVLTRILDSLYSGAEDIRRLLEPLLVARHPVQLYGALAEGVLLFLFLFFFWMKPRRPGVVASTFLVLYSAIRIVVDHYRMVDPTMKLGAFDLARGQWLAIFCLIIGFILLFVWGRRETLLSAGWGRGHSVKLHRR